MSQGDPYKNAEKELDQLLRMDGGVDTRRRSVPKNLAEELAARVAGKPSPLNLRSPANEAAARLNGPKGGRPNGMPGMPGEAGTNIEVGNEFLGGFAVPELSLADEAASAESMIRALTQKSGYSYRSLTEFDLADEEKMKRLCSFIPAQTAREKRIFPVDEDRERHPPVLVVAIYDPLNVTMADDLRLMLPEHEIEIVVAAEDEIVDAIDRFYGAGDESIENVIETLGEEDAGREEGKLLKGSEVEISVEQLANEPPVIKLVNLLLIQAIQDNASDLHVEPFGTSIRIRYRVDGVLREIPSPPKKLQLGLLSRLKVMAGLNISDSRMPQDGRIRLSMMGREIDLRVACTPTVHGESIVMRILDKSNMMIGVSQLGMQNEVLNTFLKICRRPNGIVLVTGPTGCGKTTTLYSVLTEIFDPGAKFITTEDPVEYELPGIVQVNVNPKVGLTFAACLRSILRQDPDVILVGEVRDVETAQIAVQAALTGHLVLSTLHTNSAASTVTRLIDMGIEPFLLSSTLQVVAGQRLVRTICQRCKAPYIPSDEELEDFGVTREDISEVTFSHGRGCDECNMTGYRGRIGIYEVMPVSENIRELILSQSTSDDMHAMAVHEGMMTMRQDGWLKVCYGVTTFDEINRQTHPETEESIMHERDSVRRSLAQIAQTSKDRAAEDDGIDNGPQLNLSPPTLDE